MKKNETIISFYFFLPLGAILAYNGYSGDNFWTALLFGYAGACSVFFVPYLFGRKKQNGLSQK